MGKSFHHSVGDPQSFLKELWPSGSSLWGSAIWSTEPSVQDPGRSDISPCSPVSVTGTGTGFPRPFNHNADAVALLSVLLSCVFRSVGLRETSFQEDRYFPTVVQNCNALFKAGRNAVLWNCGGQITLGANKPSGFFPWCLQKTAIYVLQRCYFFGVDATTNTLFTLEGKAINHSLQLHW